MLFSIKIATEVPQEMVAVARK